MHLAPFPNSCHRKLYDLRLPLRKSKKHAMISANVCISKVETRGIKIARARGKLSFPMPRVHWSYIETGEGRVSCESAMEGDLMKVPIEPVFTLIIGILILLVPRLLNYFVAIYLIIIGLLGLLNRVYL
jgi:hypothetical protein